MDGTTGALLQRLQVVDALTDHVQQAALDLVTRGYRDRTALGNNACSALQAIGTVHSDTAHGILTHVLLYLQNEFAAIGTLHRQRGVDGWTSRAHILKRDIDYGSDNLGYFSEILSHNTIIDFIGFYFILLLSQYQAPKYHPWVTMMAITTRFTKPMGIK